MTAGDAAEEDGQDGIDGIELRLSAQNDGEQQITLIWHFSAEVRRNAEIAQQFKHFLQGPSC